MVFKDKSYFSTLRFVLKFSLPAYFCYPLELWNYKIISKVDKQQAVGGNFFVY